MRSILAHKPPTFIKLLKVVEDYLHTEVLTASWEGTGAVPLSDLLPRDLKYVLLLPWLVWLRGENIGLQTEGLRA